MRRSDAYERFRLQRRALRQEVIKVLRRVFLLPIRRVWRRNIPVAMITGTKGKTTTSRMLAWILGETGFDVGLATTDGVRIGCNDVYHADLAGYPGHALVLENRSVTAAVLETARGGLLNFGLYTDRCDVAALLNVGREHIGVDGIETVKQMAELKRTVIDAARKAVVLNADDPLCRNLIGNYPVDRTIIFSIHSSSPAVAEHLQRGGRAYCLRERPDRQIIRLHGDDVRSVISIDELPSAWGGIVRHNIANAMAAAALAEGLGISFEKIRTALSTFKNTIEQSPGRFNIVQHHPFLLILDHACSPPAAQSLAGCLAQVNVPGRRHCMLMSAGNRADWHFRELTAALVDGFDHFVCYEQEEFRRGRAPGEIASLLKSGLMLHDVPASSIDVANDYETGLETLSARTEPGDLVVILAGPERGTIPLVERAFAAHN